MFARPVAEIDSLRTGTKAGTTNSVNPRASGGEDRLGPIGDLVEIRAEAHAGPSGKLTLNSPGVAITYDASRQVLACNGVSVPLIPVDGTIKLRALVNRGSIELFANDGRVAISRGLVERTGPDRFLIGRSEGEGNGFRSIEAETLSPAWR